MEQRAIEHQEMMLRSNIKLIASLQNEIERHFKDSLRKDSRNTKSDNADVQELEKLSQYVETLHQNLERLNIENELLSQELNKANRLLMKNCSKNFDYTNFDFQSKYEIPGYSELRIFISDLLLPNSKKYSEINFKLVNKEGKVGIEIRDMDNAEGLLSYPAGLEDDFGKYLLVMLPSHPNDSVSLNSFNSLKLNSDEMLLIGSLIDITLTKLFDTNWKFQFEIADDELRNWRYLCADINFVNCNSLTYNSSTLKEYFNVDGYAHLSFELADMYFNGNWYESFFFKVAVEKFSQSEDGRIADDIRIEIREENNLSIPLQVWPPVEKDEYGYKFVVDIPLDSKNLKFESNDSLSAVDKTFLQQLLIAAPSIAASSGGDGIEILEKERWLKSLNDCAELASIHCEF